MRKEFKLKETTHVIVPMSKYSHRFFAEGKHKGQRLKLYIKAQYIRPFCLLIKIYAFTLFGSGTATILLPQRVKVC